MIDAICYPLSASPLSWLKPGGKAREHAFYVVALLGESGRNVRLEIAKLLAQQNLVFNLRGGSERDPERATEFRIAVASAALRDVHRNRERRPTHLRH